MRPAIRPIRPPCVSRLMFTLFKAAAPLLGLTLTLLAAPRAEASLAMIRQGEESRGSRETGDLFGKSLASGDFNGDGKDDLATGTPFEDVSGVNLAGCVVINYSGQFGLKPQGAQLLLQSDGDALETAADFGWSLAAGDFDSDGYDDLAVGAPGADVDASHTNTGYVFVYAGGPGGLSYWHYLWQPGAGGSPESNDDFGRSLCVGHFDSSTGYDDLAVGSPGEDNDAGAVFYFLGSNSGLLGGANGWRKQSNFGAANTAGDQFGYSLAAAQVWSTGADELIVGTPFEEVAGVTNAGVVFVILGTSTGPSASNAEVIEPDEEALSNTPYPDGWFGFSVAGGRFYGGSYDGVAIGEPGRSYLGHPNSGRVVIGHGTSTGLSFASGTAIALFQDDAGWSLGDNDGFGRALAAGYYEDNDGYEDLAIGSPSDNANGGAGNAGVVSILFGGSNGPGAYGWVGWAEDAWADPVEVNDTFATSLVFGRFEGDNKRSLAIGAPGEDSSTGAVFIAAPWRQRQYPNYKNGIAVDCEGNWVYALRPYEEICIASTTKIMTVLIACERSQLPTSDPKYVSLDESYDVPDWIRDHIGGSLYEFRNDQRLRLRDLLRCCLYPSGNDAAYAIADILTGENNLWMGQYDNTVQTFVSEMNSRASALGMTHTLFTNPAGLDKGGPHSSASDMMLLARVAMDNAGFRGVCSNTHYEFDSSWINGSNQRVSFHDELNYGFLQNLQAKDPLFSGLKPGQTPCAQVTGVMAADNAYGYALAGSFGTPAVDGYRPGWYNDADAIMDLAQAHCGSFRPGPGPLAEQQQGGPSGFGVAFSPMSTQAGRNSSGGTDLWIDDPARVPVTALDLTRPGGAGVTRCNLSLARGTELELAPFAKANLGIAPFEAHGDITLINHGEATATFLVMTPQLGTPQLVNLAPGARWIIPAFTGPNSSWVYSIENMSQTETVVLGLSESFSWTLTGLGGGSSPVWSALLLQDDELLEQGVHIEVAGTDPLVGRTVSLTLHDPNFLVDVGDDAPAVPVAAARLVASPNPFSSATRLAFELPAAGDVRLELFDASGRRVRVFEALQQRAGRGSFDWDGKAGDGREVAPGVFFYRLEQDGKEAATGRVVRIR